jgi:hypothetical protein
LRLVIPIGRGRPGTLPHVLRSWVEHSDITELVTVGERPKGIEPDRHIDSPNAGKPHENIAGHLRKVAELGEEFVWSDDDTFLLKPWTPGVYVAPYSIAHMLRQFPSRGHWSQAVRASIKVMQAWGYDPEEVKCGTIHRPWLIESDRTLRTIDALDAVGGGSFKALYVAGLEGTLEAGNPKIVGRGLPGPTTEVMSLFNDSWKANAGRIARETFRLASRWESTPTEDTAVSVGGHARGPHRHRRG